MSKENKLLFGICFGIIFIISVSTSYGYFNSTIRNDSVKDQVVTTGTLSLKYADGAEIVMNNINPGQTITKTVYVTNTGTLNASYNLVWQELVNEIANNEMVLEAKCTRLNSTSETESGTCEGVSSNAILSNTIKKDISIEPNITHRYDITITFKDTNESQNYNQRKKFNGVIGVKEYKSVEPVSFATDSWETILNAVQDGNISKYNVGDTKDITLNTLGTHKVRIANTSTPSECSTEGFSQTACGFVLEFEGMVTTEVVGGDKNIKGWPETDLYNYLNNDLYSELPSDLKEAIMYTNTLSNNSDNSSYYRTNDKLYLLSVEEISYYKDGTSISSLTRALDYYSSNNDIIKDNGATWVLRSSAGSYFFYEIDDMGTANPLGYDTNTGISPAFRIG